MSSAGVALRDQQIGFDVTPAEVLAANARQRSRLADTLRSLDDAHWTSGSRCTEWSVQDVVRHLTQMGEVMQAAIAAARAGERYDVFKTFDPKVTPNQLVRAAGPQTPAASRAAFERSTEGLLAAVADLANDDTLLLVTPAGRQPWPRAILHALFDSAVHERDIVAALGRTVAADPAEMSAIAAYQVLLAARVACLLGMQYRAELRLGGAGVLTVAVEGASVDVSRGGGTGAPIASGVAPDVLDAMTGRGDLNSALSGPPEVVTMLSTLRALV